MALKRRKIFCLGCGYNLRDLPENRCPECGREFDPENETTWARVPPEDPKVKLAKKIARESIESILAGCVVPVVVFLILLLVVGGVIWLINLL